MLSSEGKAQGGYKHPPSLTVVRRSLARSMSMDIFFLGFNWWDFHLIVMVISSFFHKIFSFFEILKTEIHTV